MKAKGKTRKTARRNLTKANARLLKEVNAIVKRFQKFLKGPLLDHGEFLYDEKGLPK